MSAAGSKRLVRSGPLDPSDCFGCGQPVRAPAINLEGSTGSISLHPGCGERLGVGIIGDARQAREAEPRLRVVDGR